MSFRIGQRFKEKQTGRCLTIIELTDRGFKYEFDKADCFSQKTGLYDGVPEFGWVTGGELYIDEINKYGNGLFGMMYVEIDLLPDHPKRIKTSSNDQVEWIDQEISEG